MRDCCRIGHLSTSEMVWFPSLESGFVYFCSVWEPIQMPTTFEGNDRVADLIELVVKNPRGYNVELSTAKKTVADSKIPLLCLADALAA